MADKSDKLTIEALRKAAVARAGAAPFATRFESGLFPSSTIGRDAADHAMRQGFLKAKNDRWAITEIGLSWLMDRTSPREVLEDCVRALEAREQQLNELQTNLRQINELFDGLRLTIVDAIAEVSKNHVVDAVAPRDIDAAILRALNLRRAGAGADCPLPQLFGQIEMTETELSIGAFHDSLRRLHQDRQIYLHPWTGPLYGVPEPQYALLIGHEVVYYVSACSIARPGYSTAETSLTSRV